MTATMYVIQVKIKDESLQSNVIKYPVAQSRLPNVSICIVLCTISMIIVLLFATSLLVCHDEKSISEQEKTILSPEEIHYHFVSYTPSTLAIGSYLWTISKHQMEVNLTSTNENYNSCNLIIKENFTESISSAALDYKIVIWSASARRDIGFFGHIKYTVLLLDPVKCTYETIQNIEDRLPLPQLEFPPIVLTHNDSLEIFFPSQTMCFPCRFDSNANKIKIENEVQATGGVAILTYYLQTIDRQGENRSYVYAVNYKNRTSILSMLDQDFKVTNQVVLKHQVDSIAVGPVTNTSYIGIYYLESDDQKFATYMLYDIELRLVFHVDVPLSDVSDAHQVSMLIDSIGNSYVTLINNFKLDIGRSVILLRYDKSGRFLLKINFRMLEDYKIYEIQAVLLNGTKYCLIIHEVNIDEPGFTDITCPEID